MYSWADGRRYEGFFIRDKRQGYGIYMMPDHNTYSGSWFQGKQHGFGCIYSTNGHLKYGIWNQGTKLLKLTDKEATQIQEGTHDVKPGITNKMPTGSDPDQFLKDINALTNKFEPFNDFAHEQAYFELKKT